jgi:AAA family ATP:ADP antiporter
VSFYKRIVNVRRSEAPLVVLMFLYFFLVISVFWILKPLKKALFVGYYNAHNIGSLDGPEVEQLAKVGNMVVAFVAVVAFTILARKYHRHQLTLIFSIFSVVALLVFAFLIGSPEIILLPAKQGTLEPFAIESSGDAIAWSFYLFGDLFNTLMVATFFAFLNDSVKPDDAKRLYGPIVLGGVAGGAIGSSFLRVLIDDLSTSQWMLACTGMTVLIALIGLAAGKIVDRQQPGTHELPKAEVVKPEHGSPAVEGAKLVLKSRYLISIVVIVGLYEIISTILDFQFTATVFGLLQGDEAKEQISTVYAITNWVGLAIQVFATTLVMERFGVKIALMVMPIAILANSAAFLILPLLWVGSFLNTTDNGLNYSLNQSSREALWTPTSRDEKYKAKAFIDMFVQRFAKAIAVGINLVMSALFAAKKGEVGIGAGIRFLSLFAIGLTLIWLFAARYAGKQFEEMTKDKKG